MHNINWDEEAELLKESDEIFIEQLGFDSLKIIRAAQASALSIGFDRDNIDVQLKISQLIRNHASAFSMFEGVSILEE